MRKVKAESRSKASRRNALRMFPTRIIIGEIRGAEAWDLVNSMNSGHPGGMCTIHADSPRKALIKLVNLALQGAPNMTQEYMAELVGETIEMVVQVNRSVDGKRQVTAIAEVVGRQGGNGRHSGSLAARPARCAPDLDGRTPRTIAREVRGRRPAVSTPDR